MATECCSCLSQRGEDADACPVPRTCVGNIAINTVSGPHDIVSRCLGDCSHCDPIMW
jgi:hypothetical protein